MINAAIQFLSLLCAMLVNFVVPVHYGLEAYGAFIQANILVFAFHKLTDIANEPLIGQADPIQVFPLALMMAAAVWLVFTLANAFIALGSPVLLGSMLLSASVTLGLYASRHHRVLLVCLTVFPTTFFALLGMKDLGHWPLSIVDVLAWSNFISALPGLYPLAARSRWDGALPMLVRVLRAAPANVSVTLVFNLFTNLFPFLLAKTLPPAELGLFRVMTSVVQSATSLFPVSTKALFVMFRRDNDAAQLYRKLLGLTLAWFAVAALAAYALATLKPRLQPFIALMACLPVLYWAVLSERYLLAQGRQRVLVAVNLVVGSAALVLALRIESLTQAALFYAASLAVYACLTLMLTVSGRYRIAALVLAVTAPIAAQVQSMSFAAAAAWQLVLLATAILLFAVRPHDWVMLGKRL